MALDPELASRTVTTAEGKPRKVKGLVQRVTQRKPTREQVEAAAALHTSPSPAMLMIDAQWISLFADLRELKPVQRLQLLTQVLVGESADSHPCSVFCEAQVEAAGKAGRAWARAVVQDALGGGDAARRLTPVASAAAALLLEHGDPTWSADELLPLASYYSCARGNAALAAAATPEARAAWLKERLGLEGAKARLAKARGPERGDEVRYLRNRLQNLLPALHLCSAPASRAELQAAAELIQESAPELATRVRLALEGRACSEPRDEKALADALAYALGAFAPPSPRPRRRRPNAPRKARAGR